MDVRWLAEFLPKFNGVSIIKPTTAQLSVEVDACPTRAGGYIQDFGFYHFMFPSSIASLNLCIASLECFNILVAVRLWVKHWHGLVILLFCDNSAAVCALNSGKANDPLLQAIVRELWLLCVIHDVTLVARHKPGSLMVIPDALSRLLHPDTYSDCFHHIVDALTEAQFFINWDILLPPRII